MTCHERHTRLIAAMPLFNKLLVANRGEIACRIMRTAKRLGIKTVGVFSEPDARAPHVAMADEAICVGGAASSSSYLWAEAIIAAVKATGACAARPRARLQYIHMLTSTTLCPRRC